MVAVLGLLFKIVGKNVRETRLNGWQREAWFDRLRECHKFRVLWGG
jgi:hypothetical protein